ncbi:MAG: radical SAM protein [Anaerolineae bacterium]|nr:radical SAM protein [Anaerolineae bacterium]NIN95777.1 radical SAM protein [Anaerolineae bacterium]NIQ78752.1 radical SAM protein [Anaerolineae bacterium]
MSVWQSFKETFFPTRPEPLHKGMFHYMTPDGAEDRYRLHLRVEDDGEGILVINAAKVLHLNQTATEHAKLILEGKDVDTAVKEIKHRYKVSEGRAREDQEHLRDTILCLAVTDDVCPISYLDVQRIEPFDTPVSAPYRMDLALTYRCNADCGHCYVGRPRDMESLSTEEWKRVIDKLWDIGIPHVVFTGGEATLYPDLVALIRHAEDVGLVSGVLTNGIKLADEDYLRGLVDAGLDHIQITLESHDEKVHNQMVGADAWKKTVQGIKNAVATDVYTITNTTLTTLNAPDIEQTIDFLADLGIQTFACNSLIYTGKGPSSGIGIPEEELEGLMVRVRDKAMAEGMRLIWYTPTQYCEFHPLQLELGAKFCTAARYNMCVEPNGDVIPCQSYYSSLGNMLREDWQSIWNHPTAEAIRNRDWVMEKCQTCDDLPLCGGGCPLYLENEGTLCIESTSTAV